MRSLSISSQLAWLMHAVRSIALGCVGSVLLLVAQHDANAQSWSSIGPPGGTVLSMVASPVAPSVLYAGTARNGVFMSADSGQTWNSANGGLTLVPNSAWRTVRALAADGQYLYAATDTGLFYARAGASAGDVPVWSPLASPAGLIASLSLLTVDVTSQTLFAATMASDPTAAPKLYAMPLPAPNANPSAAWTPSPMPADTLGSGIGAITTIPGIALLVSVADRVFMGSIGNAAAQVTWQDTDPQLVLRQTGVVEALHYSSDFGQVYACSGGVLLSAINPLDPANNNWLQLNVTPVLTTPFSCAGMTSGGLALGSASVIALATSAGVYLSTNGSSFAAAQPLGVSPQANAVAIAGGAAPTLFVGAGFGVASQPLSTLAASAAWNSNNGPASVAAGGANGRLNNANAFDTVFIGTTLYTAIAAEQYSDVLASSDGGATWSSTGLRGVLPDLVEIPALAADQTNRVLYAGTSVGLYARVGSAWVQVAPATITEVNALAVVNTNLFVGTDDGLRSFALSANPAGSVAAAAGFAAMRISALHLSGGTLYAGVFDLTNSVATVSAASAATATPAWNAFATGAVGTHRIYSLLWTGSALLAASRGDLVSSAQPGGNWSPANTGLSDPNGVATSLLSDGSTIYVSTRSNGVFASPISAVSWTPFSGGGGDALPSREVNALRLEGAAIYAATGAGVAAINASSGGTPPPPPPSGGGSGGSSGGGALDAGSLFALLLVLAALLAPRRRARRRESR